MQRHVAMICCLSSCLGGCAVTSFAPPIVKMDEELVFNRQQTTFNAVCSPNPKRKSAPNVEKPVRKVEESVEGALILIQNFVLTYRCQAHRAAEGRQFFEVPGFLVTAGATTAAAFGAPPEVAIGAAAAAGLASQGKSYYAPQQKARVMDDALEALLCIKNEAVDVDGFTLKAISTVEQATGEIAQLATQPMPQKPSDGSSEISVSSELQYFHMIQSALFSVERVVAQRLSAAGTPFDFDGVAAELEALKKKAADAVSPETTTSAADALLNAQTPPPPKNPLQPQTQVFETQEAAFTSAKGNLKLAGKERVSQTLVKLGTLQPRLQQCVLRAKA